MNYRLLIALALLPACSSGSQSESTFTPSVTEAPVPGFTQIHSEILSVGCNFGVCHLDGAGDLTLDGRDEAYDNLVGVESARFPGQILVVPGDVEASYLVAKLRGSEGIVGDPMPPSSGLDAERLAVIEAWIAAGAAND